jgi:hypothetical protein
MIMKLIKISVFRFLLLAFPELVTNNTKQTRYRNSYYSGYNLLNPITDTNWPVYWCGIGKMDQQEFIDCVNSY